MLRQIASCHVGMNALDLASCDDHIAQSLTIQIANHMNHNSVGQFDPQATATA